MIKVVRKKDEPEEKMLRRFKKRCEREGLVKDMKKNEFYEKPSEKRRRETQKLKKRLEKEQRELD